MGSVDNRREIREFLTSRRARITPEQAGLETYGGNRRVSGLRREEVAMLAGVSADYYTRLERGSLVGASDSVLHALARALHLDDAERDHLFDLARIDNVARTTKRAPSSRRRIKPVVQQVLDAITEAAADVRNERGDIVAANKLGYALFFEIHAEEVQPPNVARYTFLNPSAHDFFVDWDRAATDVVAVLRATVGRNPFDKSLSDLVGELSTRSDEFRVRWAAHNVRRHTTGTKLLRHHVIGEVELNYQSLELPGEPGLRVSVFTAEPDTANQQALRFLASWADETGTPASAEQLPDDALEP
ncbi:helix-turn-helix transcriptional regulator [Mycolicibacillus parakoreensis]|uniref:Helix-turn-helix transcriptional regulator n=1 Tax=Mycolicibacillus parakoreensis TaxID=1069221 RepID=A0ABY3U4W6_9MYCO|nr:helix-turn-helix transcriptional regulator [Mycolicibacillus parakoreensis]ULN54543.1 helix-turn-helix transcriptional regulator [Mycolicibacillus parakoreensis]